MGLALHVPEEIICCAVKLALVFRDKFQQPSFGTLGKLLW